MTQLSLFDDTQSIEPTRPDFSKVRKTLYGGDWMFSVVDVVAVLTDSDNPRNYWNVLRHRLAKEGADQSVTKCKQLKLPAADGKSYKTAVATEKQVLRIIQSIPSPKVEPFKDWLADLGVKELEARRNPESRVDRAFAEMGNDYDKFGKSKDWQSARFQGMISRKAFTEALGRAAIEGMGDSLYSEATDQIYRGVLKVNTTGLRWKLGIGQKDNPRDHMPRITLHYVGIAEELASMELGEAQGLNLLQINSIVRQMADVVGLQVSVLQEKLGIDIVSGKPLLASGKVD